MKRFLSTWVCSACQCLLVLGLLAVAPSFAATTPQFQISQIADTSKELAVFVRGDGLPIYDGKDVANSKYEAALGAVRLPVNSVSQVKANEAGISLVIAIDVSASLSKLNFDQIKKLVADLLSQLSANSRVAVISIGSEVKLISDFTGDFVSVRNAITALSPSDQETSLYEAILKSQEIVARSDASLPLRRAVLVVTDGVDDSHRGYSKDEVMRRISEGVAPVFSIGLLKAHPTEVQREALRTLAQVSRASGGAFEQALDESLNESLKSLRTNIENGYLIRLDCSQCVRDGASQRLQLIFKTDKGIASDSREVRLFSLVPVSRDQKDAKDKAQGPGDLNWFEAQKNKIQIIINEYPWSPWAAGGAIVLIAILGFVMFRARRAQKNSESGEDPLSEHGWNSTMQIPGFSSGSGDGQEPTLDHRTEIGRNQIGGGRLLTLSIAGKDNKVFALDGVISLGRTSNNTVVLADDSEASSHHAEIAENRGLPVLADLGSTNGTYLNGTKILRPEPLSNGDVIVVGRTEIRVYFS